MLDTRSVARVKRIRAVFRLPDRAPAVPALQFTVKRKDGRSVRVETQTVPFSYDGQLFAYAFVRELPADASVARRRPRDTAKATSR